jgi:hypothetical protein
MTSNFDFWGEITAEEKHGAPPQMKRKLKSIQPQHELSMKMKRGINIQKSCWEFLEAY